MNMKQYRCFCDGGSRGNPGPAGIGAVVYDHDGTVVREVSEYVGETTNNQAEYRAVLACVQALVELGATHADFFLDSQLIVRQMNGEYRVKNEGIKPLYAQIVDLLTSFDRVRFQHVPREKNKYADALANKAMDQQQRR